MILDFSGLRVLVTGGVGGIGTEICRELHALGAEVVVHYHRSKLQAEDLAKEIGGSAIQADLTKEEDVLNLFKQIENLHGSLDCCVANAGKYPTESLPAWEISGDRLAETLDLNLKVTFYTSQEFLRRAVDQVDVRQRFTSGVFQGRADVDTHTLASLFFTIRRQLQHSAKLRRDHKLVPVVNPSPVRLVEEPDGP